MENVFFQYILFLSGMDFSLTWEFIAIIEIRHAVINLIGYYLIKT